MPPQIISDPLDFGQVGGLGTQGPQGPPVMSPPQPQGGLQQLLLQLQALRAARPGAMGGRPGPQMVPGVGGSGPFNPSAPTGGGFGPDIGDIALDPRDFTDIVGGGGSGPFNPGGGSPNNPGVLSAGRPGGFADPRHVPGGAGRPTSGQTRPPGRPGGTSVTNSRPRPQVTDQKLRPDGRPFRDPERWKQWQSNNPRLAAMTPEARRAAMNKRPTGGNQRGFRGSVFNR